MKFLGVARHFQSATRLEIPKLKHASTDLTRLLEDDLNDPDFNLRRREYLARKGAKNGGADTALKSSITGGPQNTSNMSSAPSRPQTEPNPQKKTNPADLIDFFELSNPIRSLQHNQQISSTRTKHSSNSKPCPSSQRASSRSRQGSIPNRRASSNSLKGPLLVNRPALENPSLSRIITNLDKHKPLNHSSLRQLGPDSAATRHSRRHMGSKPILAPYRKAVSRHFLSSNNPHWVFSSSRNNNQPILLGSQC